MIATGLKTSGRRVIKLATKAYTSDGVYPMVSVSSRKARGLSVQDWSEFLACSGMVGIFDVVP